MRKTGKRKYLMFGLLFLLVTFLVYTFIFKEINHWVTYIAIFLLGYFVTMLYTDFAIYNYNIKIEWLESRLKLWNTISYKVKLAGENAFNKMPIGIVVYDDKKIIQWANPYAKKIFQSRLVERRISIINNDLHNKILLSNEFDIMIYNRIYSCSVLRDDNILYLVDKTDFHDLENKYLDKMQVVGILNLDNLDQALSTYDAQEKTKQIGNIIGILSSWSNRHNIYLRGYSEEQYLLLMSRSQFDVIIEEQFKILDEIQEYCSRQNLRISASIGMASKEESIVDLVELAELQLEFAMSRGGNQAVVYDYGQVNYYGGKTSGIENRSPIYVRVKTEDLLELINKASNVVVMGHNGMDADAFSSCLAIAKIVETQDKKVNVVFDEEFIDQTIKIVYEEIKTEHVHILDYMNPSKEVLPMMKEDTLLIIVDCQYQHLLMNDKIFKKAKSVAILDHHRRSNTAIDNYKFLYSQPSASSTIELIIEMFDFIPEEVKITPIEASYMLMGIIVDTSNLMFRTSYRTFNVLSKLQKLGAEMVQAQRYLREDFDEYTKRMSILKNLEIIDDVYGIALCDEEEIHERQFIAKITDSIISINGIKAAFCIGKIGAEEIGISARSLDELNVQVLMERMGGGGHFNNAATQIKDFTISQVKEMLLLQIRTATDKGEQNMKIILTEDVKGKGKYGDIIDIPAGHANFLIRSKQAILASADNVKHLEDAKNKERLEAEKFLETMNELKGEIESKPITIYVNVGKEGKLFGAVSSKQIVETYKTVHNIVLDKRKMFFEKDIDAVGTYKIVIQLHKETKATMTVNVVEKE
ncbi:MAG TPA: 50S ribosomal protein L9 [Bacilli bacterium]|nr:50S ribosomal protein L9 [Bacilli bacterium]